MNLSIGNLFKLKNKDLKVNSLIVIAYNQYAKTTISQGKKNLYQANKLQGRPPHTSTPKNWEAKIEIKQDEKDDHHKDIGLEFCILCSRDDKRAGGNDLL
jgi:hypothetical protein